MAQHSPNLQHYIPEAALTLARIFPDQLEAAQYALYMARYYQNFQCILEALSILTRIPHLYQLVAEQEYCYYYYYGVPL